MKYDLRLDKIFYAFRGLLKELEAEAMADLRLGRSFHLEYTQRKTDVELLYLYFS